MKQQFISFGEVPLAEIAVADLDRHGHKLFIDMLKLETTAYRNMLNRQLRELLEKEPLANKLEFISTYGHAPINSVVGGDNGLVTEVRLYFDPKDNDVMKLANNFIPPQEWDDIARWELGEDYFKFIKTKPKN